MNVNKVMLVGRLTRDPEVRTTTSGQTVASIGLATGRTWTDKQGQKQEKTTFHNVVFWGRLAEVVGQYLIKGQEVFIEGRLDTRTYTGKDGVERRITEIIAENFQFGSKPQGASRGNYSAPAVKPQESQAPKEEQIPTINLDEEQGEVKIEDVPF
ncbi:MAG: single-stranded DNA-binding protein [Patescibacteria group bacterium]